MFKPWMDNLRRLYILLIIISMGSAMVETYKRKPPAAVLLGVEVLFWLAAATELGLRVWSSVPFSAEQVDGTPQQRANWQRALRLERRLHWLCYWPCVAGNRGTGRGCCCRNPATISTVSPAVQRLGFLFTLRTLFDILQLLPLVIVSIAEPAGPMAIVDTDASVLIAVCRVLRVTRVLKIVRFIPSMQQLLGALTMVGRDLLVSIAICIIAAVMLAGLAHWLEKDKNFQFSSLPKTMWGVLATLTTIGFGEVRPDGSGGKMVMSFAGLAGIGLFTLPASVIARGFTTFAERAEKDQDMAVSKVLKLYRQRMLRAAWASWTKQAELAALADRMADPNSRAAQLHRRRELARELARLCGYEANTTLRVFSKALSHLGEASRLAALGSGAGAGYDGGTPRDGGGFADWGDSWQNSGPSLGTRAGASAPRASDRKAPRAKWAQSTPLSSSNPRVNGRGSVCTGSSAAFAAQGDDGSIVVRSPLAVMAAVEE